MKILSILALLITSAAHAQGIPSSNYILGGTTSKAIGDGSNGLDVNIVGGTLNVTSSNPSVGSVGSAVPVSATAVGGNLNGNLVILPMTANGLKVDGTSTQQGVTGTVTANQGTSPWVTNVTQFGGNNIATGTGVGGNGIPRVTVSSDSSLTANQGGAPWSQNITQVGGSSLTLGQKTEANSVPVTIASDQVAPKTYINANASLAQNTSIGSVSAVTFNAPANAVGFLAEAPSSNTQNVRCSSGSAATTSSGLRLEPGRDTGYIPGGANLSCIAESGSSQEVDVQWVSQ